MAACRLANATHRSKRSSRVRGLENDWVALHQVSPPSDCNSGVAATAPETRSYDLLLLDCRSFEVI